MATTPRSGSRRSGEWKPNGVPRNRMMAAQFHRSAGAFRRCRVEQGTAPRPKTSAANSAKPSGTNTAHGAARSRWSVFARRQCDPQLHQEAAAPISATPSYAAPPITAIYRRDDSPGGKFNGRSPFLHGLNADEGPEVTTVPPSSPSRSDGIDKYAQADGRFAGKPGVATGSPRWARADAARPISSSARSIIARRRFHPRAFREIYKFIVGREPVADRYRAGNGSQTQRTRHRRARRRRHQPAGRPVRLSKSTASPPRPATDRGPDPFGPQTGADGRWGPVQVDPTWPLEIVLTSAGAPITHFYRSPFPRSSEIVHLRAARPFGPTDANAGAVVSMSRPQGLFRPTARCRADRRQGADRRESRRADGFDHDFPASGRRGRTSGDSVVQSGADRGADLAGVGKPGLRLPN